MRSVSSKLNLLKAKYKNVNIKFSAHKRVSVTSFIKEAQSQISLQSLWEQENQQV
jgi:hypothetical protein